MKGVCKIMKIENISCPNCGSKMENGYMYPTRDIRWTDNNKRRFIALGDEILVDSVYTMKKVEAYRCANCKIVTFKYD